MIVQIIGPLPPYIGDPEGISNSRLQRYLHNLYHYGHLGRETTDGRALLTPFQIRINKDVKFEALLLPSCAVLWKLLNVSKIKWPHL